MSVKKEDWSTEYLDAIVSIKIVNSLEEAIKHINTYTVLVILMQLLLKTIKQRKNF